MLIEEKLQAGDYQALKKETENNIRELGTRLDQLADPEASITKLLHKHSPRFLNLAHLYDDAPAGKVTDQFLHRIVNRVIRYGGKFEVNRHRRIQICRFVPVLPMSGLTWVNRA
jgi:hypothetical protein